MVCEKICKKYIGLQQKISVVILWYNKYKTWLVYRLFVFTIMQNSHYIICHIRHKAIVRYVTTIQATESCEMHNYWNKRCGGIVSFSINVFIQYNHFQTVQIDFSGKCLQRYFWKTETFFDVTYVIFLFSGNFGVLCFLVTSVLRFVLFALLPTILSFCCYLHFNNCI